MFNPVIYFSQCVFLPFVPNDIEVSEVSETIDIERDSSVLKLTLDRIALYLITELMVMICFLVSGDKLPGLSGCLG